MDAFIELTDKGVVNIPAVDWNNFMQAYLPVAAEV